MEQKEMTECNHYWAPNGAYHCVHCGKERRWVVFVKTVLNIQNVNLDVVIMCGVIVGGVQGEEEMKDFDEFCRDKEILK